MDPTHEYRPVSPLAVAALTVGACSALALATRFAWVVPLVGIAVAVAALAQVGRPGAAQAGRLLALAGLGLSVGFGAQAVTTAAVERWILRHRAVTAAGLWIDAVREGRPAEALGISTAAILPSSSAPGEERPEEIEERVTRFAELAAVRSVAACGGTRPTVTAAAPLGSDDGAWTVRASLAGCAGADGGGTIRLVVVPRVAAPSKGGLERWLITAVERDRESQ